MSILLLISQCNGPKPITLVQTRFFIPHNHIFCISQEGNMDWQNSYTSREKSPYPSEVCSCLDLSDWLHQCITDYNANISPWVPVTQPNSILTVLVADAITTNFCCCYCFFPHSSQSPLQFCLTERYPVAMNFLTSCQIISAKKCRMPSRRVGQGDLMHFFQVSLCCWKTAFDVEQQ